MSNLPLKFFDSFFDKVMKNFNKGGKNATIY